MILKNYIFSYVSGNYQQYTNDHSETFIKQCCLDCKDTHQIAIHRDGNLMYYTYLYKKNASTIYGFCVVCGEVCLNLKWLYGYLQKMLEASAYKGVLFNYDKQGQIRKNVVNFATEAAEIDDIFRDIKDDLEKHPLYWEQLPPEDLSVPLTSKISLAFNDVEKAKITEALRHYHNVVVTMENTSPSSFSQTIVRLNSEKEQLLVQKNGLETEIEALKRQKKQYKWVIILSLLVAVGLIAILSFNQNVNELRNVLRNRDASIDSLNTVISNKNQAISTQESIINRKEKEISNLNASLKEIQGDFDILKNTYPIQISKIEIGNTDYDRNVYTDYGSAIYSNTTMFLTPKITYTGIKSGASISLKIKWYNPNGTLSTGKSSPKGFSQEGSLYVYSGENTEILNGWGAKSKGHWNAGTYRIEIWYEDVCLKAKTFTIY